MYACICVCVWTNPPWSFMKEGSEKNDQINATARNVWNDRLRSRVPASGLWSGSWVKPNAWYLCRVIFLWLTLGLRAPSPPPGHCLLAGVSLLLSVGGAPKGECRQGQNLLHLSCMSLDSYVAPTIKRPCAKFWHSEMSDKYRLGCIKRFHSHLVTTWDGPYR